VRPGRAPAPSSQARSSCPPCPRRYSVLVRATPPPSSATRDPILEEDSTNASTRYCEEIFQFYVIKICIHVYSMFLNFGLQSFLYFVG
jgi:hypothetical protein